MAIDRVKQKQVVPKQRTDEQRRFLLRAKVDDYDDGRTDGSKQDDSDNKQPGPLDGAENNLIYYSAYTHSASPTYFKWVNLTAKQIHQSLTYRPGYMHSWLTTAHSYDRDRPQLLFYQNHPIQFVQVVGVVVSTEEWFERFWLFTIDDSSGRTIDVVCRKPHNTKDNDSKKPTSESAEEKEIQQELLQLSQQVQRDAHIGAVLQVKGTVTLFQRKSAIEVVHADSNSSVGNDVHQKSDAIRQISLQRLNVVQDTNAEMTLIATRTKFFNEVLIKPWQLNKKEQERLYRKASGESDRVRKRARRQIELLKKSAEDDTVDAEMILAEYEADEKKRRTAADEARKAGQNLLQTPEVKAVSTDQPVPVTQAVPNMTVVQRIDNPTRLPAAKRKRRSNAATTNARNCQQKETISDTTMSFGIDEDERSALLRAAFGV